MRSLFIILLALTFAVAVSAQGTPEAPQVIEMKVAQELKAAKAAQDGKAPKIYTELIAGSEKIVKGAPFSAEAVNESVQTLADGNRIVRSSSAKMYRDGEGRFRREGSVSSGALFATYSGFSSVTITDPVAGFRYVVNDKDKTVRKSPFKAFGAFKAGNFEMAQKMHTELTTAYAASVGEYGVAAKQLQETKAELEKALNGKTVIVGTPGQAGQPGQWAPIEADRVFQAKSTVATTVTGVPGQMTIVHTGEGQAAPGMKTETKTESLGMRDFDGVQAEGTRTTTTMPAGMIGNERPIDIVYEKWYSKDLDMIVYSKHSDPRFGEQTYRLANLNRNEPDPSVFAIPSDYKVQAEIGFGASPMVYKLSGVPGVSTTSPTPTAPATAPSTVKPASPPKKVQ